MQWNADTEYLVLVNHFDGDVSWAQRLSFAYVLYYKDRPDKEPFNAPNRGRDECNLIKFIMDFYDVLPKNVITVHQYEHKKKTHEGSLVNILNDSQFTKRYQESLTPGFWNFNNYIVPNIKGELEIMKQSKWWDDCMMEYFGNIEGYGDFAAGKKGAAQFVVSRDRILSLPLKFYQNMYNWLITKSLVEPPTAINHHLMERVLPPTWSSPFSNHHTARYLEWTFELIFTAYRPSVNITQYVNTEPITAVYGALNYYRDVTVNVIKHYIQNDGSLLISSSSLNSLFGDPLLGYQKTLKITYRTYVLCVYEDHSVRISPNY